MPAGTHTDADVVLRDADETVTVPGVTVRDGIRAGGTPVSAALTDVSALSAVLADAPAPSPVSSASVGASSPSPALAGAGAGTRRARVRAPGQVPQLATLVRAAVARPEVVVLLGAASLLYLLGLSASGWADTTLSAAAQAGSQSWWALLWGSSDLSASVTVGVTPLPIWVMALSVRLLGLSPWAVLLPQAVMGVATVWVVWACVHRFGGRWPAFWAGLAVAATPIGVATFRGNGPGAALVLLLVLTLWSGLRGAAKGGVGWVLVTGLLLGMVHLSGHPGVVLVLPAVVLAQLLVAPGSLARRGGRVLLMVAVAIVCGGWWGLLTVLVPSGSRPWLGGSATDSLLDVAGSATTGSGGTEAALHRLVEVLGTSSGGSWLLPAAVVLAASGLWSLRGRPRRDMTRAALLAAVTWVLTTLVVVALDARGATGGAGVLLGVPIALTAALGWAATATATTTVMTTATTTVTTTTAAAGATTRTTAAGRRSARDLRRVEALAVAMTAAWSVLLLLRGGQGRPVLVAGIALAGAVAVCLLLVPAPGRGADPLRSSAPGGGRRVLAGVVLCASALACLAGPAVLAVGAVGTPVGPTAPVSSSSAAEGTTGSSSSAIPATASPSSASPSAALLSTLLTDARDHEWAAATVGTAYAGQLQLALGSAVMPVGGPAGTTPVPSLSAFREMVSAGRIHYWVVPPTGSEPEGQADLSGETDEISRWVESTFTPRDVSGVTVYELTG